MPNESGVLGTHTSRLEKDPAREALIDALAERFYVNERATHISNGLSTDFMLFPSDLARGREAYLDLKIRNSMTYSTAFVDVEEINALYYMTEKSNWSNSLTIGLYLYLEDECSRLGKDKTFLTALRETGALVDADVKFTREDLYQKAMNALDKLGMKESHGQVLKDWKENGRFTINGVEHYRGPEPDYELHGAYTLLGQAMVKGNYVQLNRAISYALGNKSFAQGKEAREIYADTEKDSKFVEQGILAKHINECIENGDRQRKARIDDAIKIKRDELGNTPPHRLSAEAISLGTTVFSRFPDAALEIFYREGYNVAYADDDNISTCYPKKPLGTSTDDHKYLATSKGLREPHYRTLYLSNGIRPDLEKIQGNPQFKKFTLTQTLMHEIMHIAVSYLNDDEYGKLKIAVEAVHDDLQKLSDSATHTFNFVPKTMQTRKPKYPETLNNILNFKSNYYNGYDEYNDDNILKEDISKDKRANEVISNVAGLMYSEFPYPPDANSDAPNPYKDLPSLKMLADKINEALEIARNRCREEYKYVDLPRPQQNIAVTGK